MKPDPDNQLRKRIANALLSDDPCGLSDGHIERTLDAVHQAGETVGLTDIEIGRILLKMRRKLPVGERIPDADAPAPSPVFDSRKNDAPDSEGAETEKAVEKITSLSRRWWRSAPAIASLAALWIVGIGFAVFHLLDLPDQPVSVAGNHGIDEWGTQIADANSSTTPSVSPAAPHLEVAAGPGQKNLIAQNHQSKFVPISFSTDQFEKQRIQLEDGSVLYVNVNASGTIDGSRRISLEKGEIYLDVSPRAEEDDSFLPGGATFSVNTPEGEVAALGTKFGVRASDKGTGVLVTQGTVKAAGLKMPLQAGMELLPGPKHPVARSKRAGEELGWLEDLEAEVHPPAAPPSAFLGGVLIAYDKNGRQRRIDLKANHIDVTIENGFAQVTVDQTYTSALTSAVEAVFYFPVPPDAAVTRFAASAGDELLEADIVPRKPAQIAYREAAAAGGRPSLMEWQDASTFSMRIFPLEPGAEKRIQLTFSRRLDTNYGRTQFRLPGVGDTQIVKKWSAKFRVAGGARTLWDSSSHAFEATADGPDLILDSKDHGGVAQRDIVLNLYDQGRQSSDSKSASVPRFSTFDSPTGRYLMVRHTPDLGEGQIAERRDWIYLYENSADRGILESKTASGIIRGILDNVGSSDTFSIVAVGTRSQIYGDGQMTVTPSNLAGISKFLNGLPRLGALNVESGFGEISRLAGLVENPIVVHLGSGIPVLGERNIVSLLELLPDAPYVGVGVGPRWNLPLMKAAAGRTGGYLTQINPDEPAHWRAFDLLSTLNAPRLLDVEVSAPNTGFVFSSFQSTLAHGEELCAIAKLPAHSPAPSQIAVHGLLDGEEWHQVLDVLEPKEGGRYLPELWARLEIDRLSAYGSGEDEVTSVSLTHHVLSPFTSFLTTPDTDRLLAESGKKGKAIETMRELGGGDLLEEGDEKADMGVDGIALPLKPRESDLPDLAMAEPLPELKLDPSAPAENTAGNELPNRPRKEVGRASGAFRGEADADQGAVAGGGAPRVEEPPQVAAPSSPNAGTSAEGSRNVSETGAEKNLPESLPVTRDPGKVEPSMKLESEPVARDPSAAIEAKVAGILESSVESKEELQIHSLKLSQVRLGEAQLAYGGTKRSENAEFGLEELKELIDPFGADDRNKALELSKSLESDRVQNGSKKIDGYVGLLYDRRSLFRRTSEWAGKDTVDFPKFGKEGEMRSPGSERESRWEEENVADTHADLRHESLEEEKSTSPEFGISGGGALGREKEEKLDAVLGTGGSPANLDGSGAASAEAPPSPATPSPSLADLPVDSELRDELNRSPRRTDSPTKSQSQSDVAEIEGGSNPFDNPKTSRLARFYSYWQEAAQKSGNLGQATKDADNFQPDVTSVDPLDSTIELAFDLPSDRSVFEVLGFASEVRYDDEVAQKKIAEAFQNLAPDSPELVYASRYEGARALLRSGNPSASRDAFFALYSDNAHILPPFDEDLPLAFAESDDLSSFHAMIRKNAGEFVSAGRFGNVIALAWQCQETGHRDLADELLELTTRTAPKEQTGRFAAVALEVFGRASDLGRTAEVLGFLIGDGSDVEDAFLLRRAAEIAQSAGKRSLALDWLRRALALDYGMPISLSVVETDTADEASRANATSLREMKSIGLAGELKSKPIQLAKVREDFGNLLALFREHAAAMKTLEVSTPRTFSNGVVEAAENWRALDPNPSAACREAAEIFTLLGEKELAWDYITTPLAFAPDDAEGWSALAEKLQIEGQETEAGKAKEAAEAANADSR